MHGALIGVQGRENKQNSTPFSLARWGADLEELKGSLKIELVELVVQCPLVIG